MENYILKLNSGTEYKLYKGTTLVSDADLTTLFGVAGEMYLSFDFNSGTPSDLTTLTITDSSDIAVISNSNLTDAIAEGKNYKATWSNSAATFDTFEELEGKALDESQLSFLMGKIKEGKIRTVTRADYNWPTDSTPTRFDPTYIGSGIYMLGENMLVRPAATSWREGTILIVAWGESTSNSVVRVSADDANAILYYVNTSHMWSLVGSMVPNNTLTNNDTWRPLSSAQGKVLADRIGTLSSLTTTDKTSTVAAINEVNAKVPTITMTTTDPGEGSALAANTFIGVYN